MSYLLQLMSICNLYWETSYAKELAEESEQRAKEKYKLWCDQHAREREKYFEEGDFVLLLSPMGHCKLVTTYEGPYQILRKLSPTIII